MEDFVPIEFDTCDRTTDAAVCVVIDGFDRRWVPKSVIAKGFIPREGDAGRMWVEGWFAKKESLL